MVGFVLTLVVAALHFVFFAFESLLWTTPGVRRRFGMSAEQAEATKVLAANQGVYNAALGAALVWAVLASERGATLALLLFVVVVGVYGGLTAKRSILVIQALPAAAALALTWLAI